MLSKNKIITWFAALLLMAGHQIMAQSKHRPGEGSKKACKQWNEQTVTPALHYYQNASHDSISLLLLQKPDECAVNTEWYALKTLLELQNGEYPSEQTLTAETIIWLQDLADKLRDPYATSAQDYYKEGKNHLHLIKTWAIELQRNRKLNPDEELICAILSGNVKQVAQTIRQRRYSATQLYQVMSEAASQAIDAPHMVYSLTVGGWFPMRSAAVLGNHPTFGFQIGGRDKHSEITFSTYFKFLYGDQPYEVLRNGEHYSTDYFFGSYMGLDYTRFLHRWHRHELGVTAGAGWDGFDVFAPNSQNRKQLSPTSISTININGGMRYQYYMHTGASFNVTGRYNYVPYKNDGGSPLNGNVITITIGVTLHAYAGNQIFMPM